MNSTFTMLRMRNFTIILFSLWGIMNTLNAQAPEWLWANAITGPGNEYVFSSTLDRSGDGSVYHAGYFDGTVDFDPGPGVYNLTSNGLFDGFLLKSDVDGNLVWAISFGGESNDYGITVVPDESGDVFLGGGFEGSVDFDPGAGTTELTAGFIDMVVARFDADGHLIWAKSSFGDGVNFFQGMVADDGPNGGFIATGRFSGTTDFDPDPLNELSLTANDFDIFTMKMDADGELVWAKSYGSPGFDVGYSIAVDQTGSSYTTGSFRGTVDFDPDTSVFNLTATGNQCLFLSKLDADGDFVWAKAMCSPNNVYGRAIATEPHSGEIYITGLFNGKADFDPGTATFFITGNGYDFFVAKLDIGGNFLWAKSFGGSGFDLSTAIAVDPGGSGDVYTTGFFSGDDADFDPGVDETLLMSKGGDDVFISKLDDAGNLLWATSVGGEETDNAGSLLADNSGNVYVTGIYFSSPMSFDTTELLNSDKSLTTSELFVAKLEGGLSSGTADISELPLALYPNPATNTVTIDLSELESMQGQITIYNSLGKTCLSIPRQTLGHQHDIDIRALPTGTYFISVEAEGVKHTGTFSKI